MYLFILDLIILTGLCCFDHLVLIVGMRCNVGHHSEDERNDNGYETRRDSGEVSWPSIAKSQRV
jgi:hypothetical protein